mmetsp:Transcript_2621/g.10075  ORF Transcript_2621/g.10075 Transcript_2621/m.10075 type:complete len:365 (-) Transcript_2621:54-1148(-)
MVDIVEHLRSRRRRSRETPPPPAASRDDAAAADRNNNKAEHVFRQRARLLCPRRFGPIVYCGGQRGIRESRPSTLTLEVDQDPEGLLAGGVGATIWDAELTLALAISHLARRLRQEEDERRPEDGESTAAAHEIFEPPTVLALGAGCGLVAFVLAAALGARVYATDRAAALPLLRHNAGRHARAIQAFSGGTVEVAELDWLQHNQSRGVPDRVDVVVGADLVYASNAASHAGLAAILSAHLANGARGWLCHEARNAAVDAVFLSTLLRQGVHAERVARAHRGEHCVGGTASSSSSGIAEFALLSGEDDDDDDGPAPPPWRVPPPESAAAGVAVQKRPPTKWEDAWHDLDIPDGICLFRLRSVLR